MAEVVKEMPRLRHAAYPWDRWFDGRTWRLEQGVDFDTSVRTMRSTVMASASRRGIRVKTALERDDSKPGKPARWLYVQALTH